MKPDQPTRNNATNQPATPEPSTESQGDIAGRIQQGIKDANKRRREKEGEAANIDDRATQFDGDPVP